MGHLLGSRVLAAPLAGHGLHSSLGPRPGCDRGTCAAACAPGAAWQAPRTTAVHGMAEQCSAVQGLPTAAAQLATSTYPLICMQSQHVQDVGNEGSGPKERMYVSIGLLPQQPTMLPPLWSAGSCIIFLGKGSSGCRGACCWHYVGEHVGAKAPGARDTPTQPTSSKRRGVWVLPACTGGGGQRL